MATDLQHRCKYGTYKPYGVNQVLICYDNRICPKVRWCPNCGHYKMNENYINCKNYIRKEDENGKSN